MELIDISASRVETVGTSKTPGQLVGGWRHPWPAYFTCARWEGVRNSRAVFGVGANPGILLGGLRAGEVEFFRDGAAELLFHLGPKLHLGPHPSAKFHFDR